MSTELPGHLTAALRERWGHWLLVIGGLLVGCAPFLVPIHFPPWLGFHAEALAFAGLAVTLAAVHVRGGAPSGFQRPVVVLAVIAVVPWLQWLAGLNDFSGDALLSWFYLLALAAAMQLGASLTARGSTQDATIGAAAFLAAGALASAWIGIAQWLGVADRAGAWMAFAEPGVRAAGNLAQPNQLATLCLMGVACVVWLQRAGFIGRLALALLVASLTIAVTMTQSRAGLASAFAMMLLALALRRRAPAIPPACTVVAWFCLLAAAWLVVPALGELLLLGAGRETVLTDNSARTQLWAQVLSGISQRPWLGYGWNQTAVAHIAGAAAGPGGPTIGFAHNVVLDLVVWLGIPLASGLLAILAYWTWTRVRAVRHPQAAFALLMLVPVVVHSQFEFPFAYAYFLIPVGIAAGIIEAHHGSPHLRVPAWLTQGLFGLWVGLGIGIALEYRTIEEEFRIVRFAAARIGFLPAGAPLERIRLNSHMDAMLDAARMTIAPRMRPQQLDTLRLACDRFPYSALTLRCAVAFALNGRPDQADAQMARYRALYGEAMYRDALATYRREVDSQAPGRAKP